MPFKLTVNIECDTTGEGSSLQPENPQGTKCQPVLNYKSKKGCPVFTASVFTKFLADYYYLWGAALILLGAFLCFFGNKFVNFMIFMIVALGCFCILGSLFFYMFFNKVQGDTWKWVTIAGIILISLLLGFIVQKNRKYGIAIVAAWGGVMLGFVIITTFLISETWLYWVILVAFALAAAALAIKVETGVICGITSFVGGYSLIRGVSLYAGGFPPETQLHEMIKSGAVTWADFDKKFYIYLAAIVVVSIMGFVYQWKHEIKLRKELGNLKRPLK